MQQPASWLCLGDSYTIGEGVPLQDTFAYQCLALMREEGWAIHAPEIVAQTGWTSGELLEAVRQRRFQSTYDFVTLLIGVNNQYRNGSIIQYAREFETLLQIAIGFSGHSPQRVIVLSIPDWGGTPFAADRDRGRIATEIDAFNNQNLSITQHYKANYLDITDGSRRAGPQGGTLAADGLHPSGKLYQEWSTELFSLLKKIL